MAMGTQGGDGSEIYFMSIRGLKKGEKAYIKVVKPDPEKEKEYIECPNIQDVSGSVQKIEVQTKTFEGESYEEMKFWLKDFMAGDSGQTYCLSCGVNSIGRNIINSLASIEGDTIGTLFFNVYTKKGSDFPSIYIEHNGVKLSWKLEPAEMQKLVGTTKKKVKGEDGKAKTVDVKDYFDLNEKFLTILREEIIPKVKPSNAVVSKPANNPEDDAPEDDSELPF